ncbi:MAG: hypothetical protein ACJ72O_05490 [Marmoricola sp.]
MSDNDDGLTRPRHRKNGRASKRGTGLPGRHLQLVTDGDEPEPCACPPGFHEYGTHAPGARGVGTPITVPRGAYPVEDLAGMSASAAEMLLHRATAEAETDAATCPHIVITRDVVTGVVTYSGPFETGLQALTMAHEFVGKYRNLDPRWDFTLTVAPLFPQ